MKYLLFTFLLSVAFLFADAQTKHRKKSNYQIVEAACGQCQFGMKADGCDLAVRIKGKSYFVKGSNIDNHGDAHAKRGLCNAVRKAKVKGKIKKGKFVATYFKLI